MEHKIKELAETITNTRTKNLVESHVKGLHFENKHLIIYVDNISPLHELETDECDHHLQNGMEKIYGDISYELKIDKPETPHEREKEIPHDIHQ